MVTDNDICMSRVNAERIALGNVHVHSHFSVGIDLKYPEGKQPIKQLPAETQKVFKQTSRILRCARPTRGAQIIGLESACRTMAVTQGGMYNSDVIMDPWLGSRSWLTPHKPPESPFRVQACLGFSLVWTALGRLHDQMKCRRNREDSGEIAARGRPSLLMRLLLLP